MKNLKFSFETSVSKKLNPEAKSRDEVVVPVKTPDEYGEEWLKFILPFLYKYVRTEFFDRTNLAVVSGFDNDIQYNIPVSLSKHKRFEPFVSMHLGICAKSLIKALRDPTRFNCEQTTELPITITVILPDNEDGRFRIELHDNASKPNENVFKIFVTTCYTDEKAK